jgi:glycine cleavage system H protein
MRTKKGLNFPRRRYIKDTNFETLSFPSFWLIQRKANVGISCELLNRVPKCLSGKGLVIFFLLGYIALKKTKGVKAMEIEGYSFPEDLYYHKEHYWARVEPEGVTIGTSDFAQKLAGQIVFVELPSVGKNIEQGKPCGSMESGKWVGRIYAPVSGKVESVNEELEESPELINSSPYEKGWIFRITPSNLQEELKGLMKGDPLLDFIKSEIQRVKKIKA